MTARPFEQQIPRRLHAKHNVSSRTFSIILAVTADAGLALLLFQRNWISSTDDIEPFWVRQFIAFAIYSALQLWTLAYQTGRGDEIWRRRRIEVAGSKRGPDLRRHLREQITPMRFPIRGEAARKRK